MGSRTDAIRRVRALHRTAAVGSGATEPERATALRLAERIARTHGLAPSDYAERPAGARRSAQSTPSAPRGWDDLSDLYAAAAKARRMYYGAYSTAPKPPIDSTLGVVLNPDDISFGSAPAPDEGVYPYDI